MPEIRDIRPSDFFWLNNACIDEYAQKIGPAGIAVYCALARFANRKNQEAYPSIRTLARLLGMSHSTVIRQIDQLVMLGMITKETRHSAHGDAESNIYTLIALQSQECTAGGGVTTVTPGVTTVTGVVHQSNTGWCTRVTEPEEDLNQRDLNQKKHSCDFASISLERASEYSPGFLRFWAGYPRKIAKGKAWDIWKTKRLEPLTTEICRAVNAFQRRDWQDQELRFIPYPTTFLNGKRWESDFEPEHRPQWDNKPYGVI